MAKLIVTFKNSTVKEVSLTKDGFLTIGRDPENTLHLENPSVSRFHAKVYKQGWPFYLEDLKSTNGTFHNGNRVNWKVALSHNDRITIGKHTLIFMDGKFDYEEEKEIDHPNPDMTIRMYKKDG